MERAPDWRPRAPFPMTRNCRCRSTRRTPSTRSCASTTSSLAARRRPTPSGNFSPISSTAVRRRWGTACSTTTEARGKDMSFELETAAHPEKLRRVAIDPVSRVEGHGKVTLLLDENNRVHQVRLHIVEFRGFEKFIQGRPYWEVPV